jgi:hypothetical protein
LEEKFCNECGEENAIRYEALKKLEGSEREIEEVLAKRSEKLSKRRTTRRENRLEENMYDMQLNKLIRIKLMKTKLITGDTREGIREWIKTQHYDLKRTIHDIADDSGMSIFRVKNFIEEIENEKKSHQQESTD